MIKRSLACLLALAAAAPASAGAADTVLVPFAQAQRLTALDGTIVWIDGAFPNQRLMQRNPDGTVRPVARAPVAAYFSIDLGRTSRGALVLTYGRCRGTKNCKALSDDLAGRRTAFAHLAPRNCRLTAVPSRWGRRVAYGLACTKRRRGRQVTDRARSGLYVRTFGRKARHLSNGDRRTSPDAVRWVDLRGTVVGAAATDVFSFAFSQTIGGARLRSELVAASEGDSDETVAGLALGTRGVLWTLVDATHAGDPNVAVISRIVSAGCSESERLVNPPGRTDDGFLANALAVDGRTLYLSVPGVGIVEHAFQPARPCPVT